MSRKSYERVVARVGACESAPLERALSAACREVNSERVQHPVLDGTQDVPVIELILCRGQVIGQELRAHKRNN